MTRVNVACGTGHDYVFASGSVRLWDVATGQQIGSPLNADSGPVEFSPDGKTLLATGDRNGSVRLFDVGYLVGTLTQLCTRVSGSLTPAE